MSNAKYHLFFAAVLAAAVGPASAAGAAPPALLLPDSPPEAPAPFRIGESALDRIFDRPRVYLDAVPARPHPATLTLYYLNDGDSVRPCGTDRHYTAGVSIALACQSEWARDFGAILPSFFKQFDPARPNTTFALGLITGLDIYTPQDYYTRVDPDPTDHPYAGWLYGGVYFQRARTDIPSKHFGSYGVFEHIELDLGMVGPSSQADKAQEFIHDLFGYEKPLGWDHQIHDEFGFNFIYQRKYRFTLLDGSSCGLPREWALQLLPHAGFTLGTIDRFVNAGATFRAGWLLPDDFGPTLIHQPPAATGSGEYRNFGAYLFVRLDGKLVQYNTTLEGNNFRDSPGVDAHPAVGSVTPGFALQFLRHLELTYSQTFLTKEYEGQPTADAFGTLSLNVFWNF